MYSWILLSPSNTVTLEISQYKRIINTKSKLSILLDGRDCDILDILSVDFLE